MYRAMESERPDAIFNDPFARRLAGERGVEILGSMPRARSLAWPMIVRTAVMDEIILRCVGRGARTVINLAAGLDARAFRLGLPATLTKRAAYLWSKAAPSALTSFFPFSRIRSRGSFHRRTTGGSISCGGRPKPTYGF
jgi:hypothetical protein